MERFRKAEIDEMFETFSTGYLDLSDFENLRIERINIIQMILAEMLEKKKDANRKRIKRFDKHICN